ncbi:MAG: sensor histidine kinase, partial [Ginsengibacter sp.]
QETEREMISYELRDKVNQTLASSKMMLDAADSNEDSKALFAMISHNIHETIDELNRISTDLTPSVIIMIGFVAGVKEYINSFQNRFHLTIHFNCLDEKIESFMINDKISIFRIIQDYLLIISGYPACKIVNIEISRSDAKLMLSMQNNFNGFELPIHSTEFIDIEHRLEYYDGTWNHFSEKNKKTLLLEFNIPS